MARKHEGPEQKELGLVTRPSEQQHANSLASASNHLTHERRVVDIRSAKRELDSSQAMLVAQMVKLGF